MAYPTRTLQHLIALYGEESAGDVERRLRERMGLWIGESPASDHIHLKGELSERDAILITYGDQVSEPGKAPLKSLAEFCQRYLPPFVTGLQILPFYPFSSDDGFSVIDYRQVDPALGSWEDIERLRNDFALMFDAVINHISAQSAWFQGFIRGEQPHINYFIQVEGSPDLSQVVRPRVLPLLTSFDTSRGSRSVWTTFSADQIDLNYANPDVLLEIIDTILFYVSGGAELLRLDAIAYLWKQVGTSCIHLPQTHHFIQLLRAILDEVAPYVFLITETNVPHKENISYFGDGINKEAQLVYNFALPPLVLHTVYRQDARALSGWAADLKLPAGQTTFFNFLASHDGIGLNPVREILSPSEIDTLVEKVQEHGGLVSCKQNADGTQSPYELNISYFDALSDPLGGEPLQQQVDRFAIAHAILCALVGVPGIYFHSLFGSRSWIEGVKRTGRNRTINRQKLAREQLEAELSDPDHLRSRVFSRLSCLLQARAGHPAFHPRGSQEVVDAGPGIFAIWRITAGGNEKVFCLHNITSSKQEIRLPDHLKMPSDLLQWKPLKFRNGSILLEPYQSCWLLEERS